MSGIVYTIQDLKTKDVVAVVDNDYDVLRFLYSHRHDYPQIEGQEKTIDERYHELCECMMDVQDLNDYFCNIDIDVHHVNYDYGRDPRCQGREIEDVAAEAGIKIAEEDA